MHTVFATLAISFLLVPPAVGARGQDATQDEGFAARVDSIFSPYARPDAPGCAVSVMKAGKIVYARGYGMADVAHGIPLTPRTPLWAASTSKQFTALAVLLLEGDGKLRLDDDVRRYLPEVPDFGHPLTIRKLLNHTSGLRELANLFYMAGWRSSDVETKADVLTMIRRQRALNHVPGTEFAYNSAGYTLLAVVVERVSGVSFRRFVIDRIFIPLGMAHSDVREDVGQVVPHLATGYWGHDPAKLRTARPANSFAGPNGVITSVEDLARWDANFYEHRVGTQAMLNQMSTPGRLADGTEFGYGMGLYIGSHRGRKMISHAGSDYGYKAEFVRFPAEQLSVAVLCNAFDVAPTPLALQLADLYLPRREDASVPPSPTLPLPGNTVSESAAAFAGLYWNDATMQSNRFFYEQGKLLLDGGGEGRFELRALGNNAYRLMEAPRRFVFTFFTRRDGSLAVLVDVEGSPVQEKRRVADTKPNAAALRALEGRYFSPELDVTWTFVVRDGALVLERHRMNPTPLSPVFGEVFQAEDFFVLAFRRDSRTRTLALEVSTERARRVRFTRVLGRQRR
ncbi:MAG TPA: serine hydrolase domain-containing protein [Pyrinomonadaceae bacterium]|nr:serine hydrolase domain-containing protein [Pyrinomonadaceae bacterium]